MLDEHGEECPWCQGKVRAAWALREKRLGTHERRVLVRAAPPGQLAEPILPPGTSHSSQTATRRAVSSLQKAGLIVVPPERRRIYGIQRDLVEFLESLNRDYAVLRFAIRTGLGEAVVEVFGRELTIGGKIRWAIQNEKLTAAVVKHCPYRTAS